MCMEDLRLGRGRAVRNVTQIGPGISITLPADPSRVALAVAFVGTAASDDFVQVGLGPSIQSPLQFTLGAVQSLYLFRVEDYGQLVTGQITFGFNNPSGAGQLAVIEIYTEVNAPPLNTYIP